MKLAEKKCVPCEAGGAPMAESEARKHLAEISGWTLADDSKKIEKVFKHADFKTAMMFINKVAEIAESEGHHPDIAISYSTVTITLWTHAVLGLSLNDFILAAKIDAAA